MIYHITTADWWARTENQILYKSPTLAEEGFIHCSTAEQVAPVLQRYYVGQQNLRLLHIQPEKLTAEWKYEASTNDELYPHVYGPINREAIVHVEVLSSPRG